MTDAILTTEDLLSAMSGVDHERERKPRRAPEDDNEIMTPEQIAEYEQKLELERATNARLMKQHEDNENEREVSRLTEVMLERERVALEDAPPGVPRVIVSGKDIG